ncbi:outer membrane beta-barrel protein [Hymenobacter pini]|uniref:outer membrane beta-barrel protein n=1 Tax=Hymenobacter pini TaxID=2880879 RepID=UPI001CF39447|nr:outer membrane beta-barrel protein [Hymenobacter pini]MCA8832854.1 outer membrane beta-barrel protein [Hymenobacter pini]
MKHSSSSNLRLVVAILGLLLAWHSPALAQTTVTGRALDQDKKEALSFATVVLKAPGAEGKVVQSTLADDAGAFSMKAPAGSYQLNVLMVGYTTLVKEVQVAPGTPTLDLGTLGLSTAAHNLGEVVVTARRPVIEQKLDRVTMNVGESVLAAGNDGYSLLAMAPSVQLIDGRLSFRGKSNVLILLNGKRLPGANLESVLASIPGDQIERIELISNPSAKYDADASGGVIEIYTKRSKELGWTANVGTNVSQGYRTAGGLNGGLRVSTAKIDFTATLGYTRRGNLERGYQNRTLYQGLTPVGRFAQDVNLDDETIQNRNVSGSLNYHFNKRNTVGVDVSQVLSRLDGSGRVKAVIDQPQGTTFSNSFNNMRLRVDFANYNLFYRRVLDSLGSSVLVSGNYANYISSQQQTFDQELLTPQATEPTKAYFRNSAPANYDIYTAAADYTKVFSPTLRLEAGAKLTRTGNSSRQVVETMNDGTWYEQPAGPLSRLGYQERIAAGYVSVNRTSGKLGLQMGLRAEQTHYRVIGGIDSSYFSLFPNLRADYKVSDQYSTALAYAKNINRPSYASLIPYELFLDNYTSQKGNAYLRPEYVHTFSWNHLYKGFGLQLAYTQTTNAMSTVYLYDPATLRLIMTQRNFRQRHQSSATFTAPLTPAKWWTMNNNVSLLYQELTYPTLLNETSRFDTKSKFYYTASSDNTFTLGKGWTAQLYAAYNSPSFTGLLDYSAYSYVSTGIKKTFWDKKAFLKLDVADLFYQANIRVSSNVAPAVTDGILRNDTRRVRLAFSYKLGKTDLKSKRVQSNGNAAELNRLGM